MLTHIMFQEVFEFTQCKFELSILFPVIFQAGYDPSLHTIHEFDKSFADINLNTLILTTFLKMSIHYPTNLLIVIVICNIESVPHIVFAFSFMLCNGGTDLIKGPFDSLQTKLIKRTP